MTDGCGETSHSIFNPKVNSMTRKLLIGVGAYLGSRVCRLARTLRNLEHDVNSPCILKKRYCVAE